MQKLLKFLKPELFSVQLKTTDQETLFRHMHEQLYQNGMVKETFLEGILARERRYPTGLRLGGCGCALPHTDTMHVVRPGIAVATLQKPMTFRAMGDPKNEVQVHAVFMMALRKEEDQVAMLGELAAMFQNETAMQQIIAAKSGAEILGLIQKMQETAQ